MKKDRVMLEERIYEEMQRIAQSRKSMHRINENTLFFNIPVGTLQSIATGMVELEELSNIQLCQLCLSIYKETENMELSPFEYFTETELQIAHKSKNEFVFNKNNLFLPLKIQNVIMVDLEHYITKIKLSYLVKMYHSQLILYDFETQRSAKFKRGSDGVVPVPDVNRRSVEEISRKMIDETYLSDMITLNVYSDEVEPVQYHAKNMELTINEGAVISILDGFHRLTGGVRAMEINPELDLELILSIRSYDTEKAKKYFGQINTINVVKPERLRELKQEKYSDIVVRDLQQKSDLKGKIASAAKVSKLAGQLTTFDILSYAIDNVFRPTTTLEARECSNYLIHFFTYLVGNFTEEFITNPDKYKYTYLNHPLMFAGYIQIAKNFLDENKRLNEIKKYVDAINFKDERLVAIFESPKGPNHKKNRDMMIDYFQKG